MLKKTNSRSVSELFDRCSFQEWQQIVLMCNDYHNLIKSALELYIKYKLDSQRSNMWDYACNYAKQADPDAQQFDIFNFIFHNNGIDPSEFAYNLKAILNKECHKINALRIVGSPDAGKSLISNCIVEPFITCYMNNHASENEFYLSNMLNKSIILCEELYITIATAEDFKSVLGGQPIDVSKKHNEKQLLARTPCIITSNYLKFGRGHLSPVDENALSIRCFNYRFNHPVKPHVTCTSQQFYLYLMAHMYK